MVVMYGEEVIMNGWTTVHRHLALDGLKENAEDYVGVILNS